MSVKTQAADAALAASASKATYGGAASSGLGVMFSSEAAALAGALVAVLGLLINLYFRRRQDRREEREHELRMRSIEREVVASSSCRGDCHHNERNGR